MTTLALLFAASMLAASPAALPDEATVLKTMRAERPRLIATAADAARLKQQIASDPRTAQFYADVKKQAEKFLKEKPVEYKIVGPRLLNESRKCLNHVFTFATVYRLEGDKRCRDRAIEEMLTAANFKDWNPSHFLDTAEMTNALAIGYDWLYSDLTPAQRKTIREAIVNKGLKEGEKVYRKGSWWAKSRHNWNQVCNGGMTVGALSVADEEPALARYIVAAAVHSVPLAMAEFAPDGGWAEGPGYWSYATSYNCYMLAALDSALGTDFGLSKIPGFSLAGEFRIHLVGTSGLAFNFADGGDRPGGAWQMYWFARKFNQPFYAWHEREAMKQTSAQALWWFDTKGELPRDAALDRWFRGVDVVMLRGAWTNRATYVGFKGGDNKVNHSHLELGDFVLDADGQRWAVDLGSDDYNLPAYFGNKRWTYYRLGTQGQNTLCIDGQNQQPKAVAPIVAFDSGPTKAFAVADLTAAYAGQVKRAQRGIALVDRQQVLVQDEIQDAAGEVVWQMHTRAKVEIKGQQAFLAQQGEKLLATILSPADAKFATASANPPEPQKQNPDVTKLVIKLPKGKGSGTLAVLFTPGSAAGAKPPQVVRLSEWKADGATGVRKKR